MAAVRSTSITAYSSVLRVGVAVGGAAVGVGGRGEAGVCGVLGVLQSEPGSISTSM